MHIITEVKYLKDFKLAVTFNNQIKKVIDLEKYLDGEVFEPLKDLEYFKKVKLNPDIDTITWPNNADFSPDFLFEISERF